MATQVSSSATSSPSTENLTVYAGGAVVTASPAKTTIVSSGQVSSDIYLSGTNQIVSSGGSVLQGTITGGTTYNPYGPNITVFAQETVLSGGTVNGVRIWNGAIQLVSGGTVKNTTIVAQYYGGAGGPDDAPSQIVTNGGTAYSTAVQGVLSERVFGSLIVYYTNSSLQTVSSGGTTYDTTVDYVGSSYVAQGGTAIGTTLSGLSSAWQQIYDNFPPFHYESVTSTWSAVQKVDGYSESATVSTGGILTIGTTGVASHTVVFSGGILSGSTGSELFETTISNGGYLILDSGAIIEDPLSIQSGGAITFTDITAPPSTLSGIFVQNSLTRSVAPTTLEIMSGTTILKEIPVTSAFSSPLYFRTAPSGSGAQVSFGTPCYCPGTLIMTPDGECPVETLHIGDMILTANGHVRPIRWIGRRSYDPVFAHGNRDILPILIHKGALGNNLPARNLMISPLHAMFIDGLLIPALHLVNGRSIIQVQHPGQINYIHIELDTHDILLAERAPSESFVDDGSRGMFHNAGDYDARYPDAPRHKAIYCAPRVEEGPLLETIHRRLTALSANDIQAA